MTAVLKSYILYRVNIISQVAAWMNAFKFL